MKLRCLMLLCLLLAFVFVCGCTDAQPDNEKKEIDNKEPTEEIGESSETKEENQPFEPQENTDVNPDDDFVTEPEPKVETPVQQDPESEPQIISVEDIKLTMYEVTVFVGEKKMPIVTMYPQNATDKSEIWESSDTSVATVDYLGNIKGAAPGKCIVTVKSAENPSVFATVNVTVNEAPVAPVTPNAPTEPTIPTEEAGLTYIDGILIVNKTYPLPSTYAPGWETEATPYLWKMIEGAKKDGITLWMKSGYRSYNDQKYIYNNYVARDGQAEADTYSARPGHSEHQTGLAYDLNSTSNDFAGTPEAKWIEENCYKYGFILRYPKGKEHITGYIYEPWHVRYVGIDKAKEIYESGLCLEEFYNITSVYA